MQWKSIVVPILALLFVSVNMPARSQVAHSASEGTLPLTIGFGVSDFLLDWGHSRKEMGVTAWADWRFRQLPPVLNDLGIEIEGRDINFNVPSALPGHRMDTGLGGPIYQWRRHNLIRPYGKFLIGFGSIDFPGNSTYTHDTRTIFAPGGGLDVHGWRKISVRADYEYQFWRQLFGPHDLNPNGVTLGVAYDFGRRSY